MKTGSARARDRLRGTLALTATYVYFLLFAQYGFLRLYASTVPGGPLPPVMAAMGLAGLGANFEPLLVFAYHLVAGRSPVPEAELFEFRGERYGFVAIRLADYVPHARPLSTSWDTVTMSTPVFRRYALMLFSRTT